MSTRTLSRKSGSSARRLAAIAVVLLTAGSLPFTPKAHGAENFVSANTSLVPQSGTTAVAIHFDAWLNWRYAYENLLINPQARYLNRVAVSAGRADWTYFRWPGHESWWSSEQKAEKSDILESTLATLGKHGYRTTAIFDVYGARYLQRFPEAAAIDIDGNRSKDVICSTELAEGAAGHHLEQAIEALASSTQADTIAVTELFYDRHCYDDRCLIAYKKATGRQDWPRTATGKIDYLDPSIGAWRSRQVAGIVARLAEIVHRHGKKFALDVKISRGDLTHNSLENGQDYHLLAPYVDEFVVWDYFATEGDPPESTARVANYFTKIFGANKFFLSIGLWGRSGTIDGDTLERALHSARQGGARQIWITPAEKMTASHWTAIANTVRTANGGE